MWCSRHDGMLQYCFGYDQHRKLVT
jgi:hypothetical protein